MHWSTLPFVEAHAALAETGGSVSAAQLLEIISPIEEDIRQLFAAPPKSNASRDKLVQNKVEVNGQKLEANEQFVWLCVMLADELNLDEIACAELVNDAQKDAYRIGFNPMESAASLFYTRRALVLDILRFCIEVLPFDKLSKVLPAARIEHFLDGLKSVEQSLQDLNEKTKTSEFMGLNGETPFTNVQRQYLQQEHESLAELICTYLSLHGPSENSTESLSAFLKRVSQCMVYDGAMVAYLAIAMQWFMQPHTNEFVMKTHSLLSSAWKIEPWKGAVSLVFYTYVAEESRKPVIEYTEVLKMLRQAIDAGGVEFLLGLAQDVHLEHGESGFVSRNSLMRARVPRFTFALPESVYSALQTLWIEFINQFVTNCADILKEMRNCEEDTLLALSSDEVERVHSGVDLERFFLFVACVYEREPERAELFFVDKSDALYGFLVWGADMRVPYMMAAYTEMVAAFANSARNCAHVHRFLLKRDPRKDDQFLLCWESVYEFIEYYIRSVTSPTEFNSFRTARHTQPQHVSEETLQVVASYVCLVYKVCVQCPEALVYIRGQVFDEGEPSDMLPLLYKLLKLGSLKGAVLHALIPFANADTWPALDAFAYNRWDEALVSKTDILAFTQLVEKLVSLHCHGRHLNDHLTFILTNVLPGSLHLDAKDVQNDIQLSCLNLVSQILPSEHSNDGARPVFKLCFSPLVYSALFSISTVPVDKLDALTSEHIVVRKLTLVISIISTLLEKSSYPLWSFDKPVLYNLEIVPYLALYLSSKHTTLALASIKLFTLLQSSPEFKPSVERQSRVLSILTSTTESARIRIDMLSCLRNINTKPQVKIALLNMVLQELSELKSTRYPVTVAHFLLGYRQSALGMEPKIELDPSIGGILSSNSVFGAVCELLVYSLACANNGVQINGVEPLIFARLTSAIVGKLVNDPLTCEITLNYLRPLGFVLELVKQHPASRKFPASDDLYEYRAVLLSVLKLELQACQTNLLLTREKDYLDALVPTISTFVDFKNLPGLGSSASLDCVVEWCLLVPVLVKGYCNETGFVFVTRVMKKLVDYIPVYSRSNTRFAKPIASLLVLLLDQYLQLYKDDVVIMPFLQITIESALKGLQPAQINSELRLELYSILSKSLKAMVLHPECYKSILEQTYTLFVESGPVTFEMVCQDVLDRNSELQTSALTVLDLVLLLEQKVGDHFVMDLLLKLNFIASFVEQVVINPNSLEMSLLFQVSQSFNGAQVLVFSSFITGLGTCLPSLQGDVLMLSIQSLIAIIVTLGESGKSTQKLVADILNRNKLVVEKLVHTESQAKRNIQILQQLVAK